MITNEWAQPARAKRTNPLAIAALVCGIVQVGLWPAAFAAIILGHKAVRQIHRDGDDGSGLAKAGLTLGYVGLTLMLLVLLWLIVAFVHFSRSLGGDVSASEWPSRLT
jgi:Domain of unknown function (DUF4190)